MSKVGRRTAARGEGRRALSQDCMLRIREERPLIRGCRTTFSPLARGEGTAGVVARMQGCTLVKAHAGPFSPWRRGEGAAAAADEGRFRAFSATADEVARAHCCNVDRTPPPTAPHPVLPHHLLPAARGEGTGMRCRRNAELHSGENACWSLLPVATGSLPRTRSGVRRQPRMRGHGSRRRARRGKGRGVEQVLYRGALASMVLVSACSP